MTSVGVLIRLPQPFAADLEQKRISFGDAGGDGVPPHVTLLPPVDARGDRDELLGSLRQVAAAHQPFDVVLRGTGTFRPVSPVVFVAVSECVENLELLAADIRLAAGEGAPDYPFHPHVTVAHNLDDAALDHAFAALARYEAFFTVDKFELYVQRAGSGWSRSEEFCLG